MTAVKAESWLLKGDLGILDGTCYVQCSLLLQLPVWWLRLPLETEREEGSLEIRTIHDHGGKGDFMTELILEIYMLTYVNIWT